MGRRALAVRCDVTDRDAGRRGRRARRRGARLGRHPRQQRRHARPRRPVRRPAARALGARPARQPDRRVQLRAGRLAAHEGAQVGPDREHGLRRGHARRLRPGVATRRPRPGVLGLTKTLAMEGGRHGITANAVVPGDHRHRGVPHGERVDERADREPDRLQAARASRRTSRTRSPGSAPTSPRTSPGSS